jgi:hypothetical protein
MFSAVVPRVGTAVFQKLLNSTLGLVTRDCALKGRAVTDTVESYVSHLVVAVVGSDFTSLQGNELLNLKVSRHGVGGGIPINKSAGVRWSDIGTTERAWRRSMNGRVGLLESSDGPPKVLMFRDPRLVLDSLSAVPRFVEYKPRSRMRRVCPRSDE